MLQSQIFTKTKKDAPRDEESINAILLQRGGFIYKEMAGAYSFLPLGLKVLRKIENIVREEINGVGGQEVSMTILQPKALWQKTNRWDEGIGQEVMYKCEDNSIGLGPTHEEMLTDIVANYVASYEDLPFSAYQIQTKFRKEKRAKSGILRGREFLMKDLYSFHASTEDFKKYYEEVKKAYLKIFKRCGLDAIITEASGGGFTSEFSHEFQVISKAGEDEIIYCDSCWFSQNKEVAKLKEGDACPNCGKALLKANSIEAGNIFPLGDKYSKPLGAFFTDKTGEKKPIIMGCYGIGITRLMGTIVEAHNDKNGIIWPIEVAPFRAHIVPIYSGDENKDKEIEQTAIELYNSLIKSKMEVLFDDRKNKSTGEKFADADLLGAIERIVISEKTLKEKSAEIKNRETSEIKMVKIDKVKDIFR